MNDEIKELLKDIQDWMMENDYECGPVGSEIYHDITIILKKYDNNTENRHP